ncbi:MAG: sigma-70 family RNA polymerase sigma factor [Pseudomonadota bacterium]|nr:sigma-70 family RNA polymerase sigma factor [Pseudomonadota bacterium]
MQDEKLPSDIAGHMPELRRFAMALTREPSERDDLVQDTILRALEKRDRLRDPGGLKSWLFQIMQNRFIDLRRATRSRAVREAQLQWTGDDHSPAKQDHVVRLGQIRRAFDRLPPEQKRALELVALDGMTCRAAADRLEVPLGTLLSRLARAREALRRFEDRVDLEKETTDDR